MKKHFMKLAFLFLTLVFSNLSNAAVVNVSIGGNNTWDSNYASTHPISISFSYDTSNSLKDPNYYAVAYELLDFDIDVGKDLNIENFNVKYGSIQFQQEYGLMDSTMLSISFMSSLGNENFMFFASFYYYPWFSPWLSDFDNYALSAEELSKIVKTGWQSDTMWAYYTGPYFGNILDSSYNIYLDPSTLVVSYVNAVPEPSPVWLLSLGIVLMSVLRRSSQRVLSS